MVFSRGMAAHQRERPMRNLTHRPHTKAQDLRYRTWAGVLPYLSAPTTIGSRALPGSQSLLGGATSVPGRFIAIEGTDGVGKTSLARRLADVSYETAVARLAEPATSTTTPDVGAG